ncbi:MAG: hypothetical protein L6R39_006398 [Caloplaca ligustica]|nr:MAG: hypothetical protein L6R39_006398 [Caloplaca ligustica]
MHPILDFLLSHLPFDWIWRLHSLQVRFRAKWYHYFPNPTPKHLCLVCKETLQKKNGGYAADGFIEPSEDSGQQQFETYGQVNCPHHTSVQSLRDSAEENCLICSRVWSSFAGDPDQRQSLLEDLDRGDDILTYCYIAEAGHVDSDLHAKGGRNCLVVSVGVPERVFSDAPKPATFILLPTADMVNYTPWPRLPSYSTSSFQSWFFARFWYRACLESHDECNRKRRERSSGKQWYPTRLIKISPWSNKLRLVLPEQERLYQQSYCTLSHCWGKADFLQLTQSSKVDFFKDIPYRKLPKTFQDAISVARGLGIYYIWIDSLCIIQREESLTDWKREAAKMDQVYSHAILNISATGASDGSKGLFFPRSADTMELLEIQLDWTIREKFSHQYTVLDYDYWKRLVVDEPLIRRAWVVQERLLAPRVLHFGSTQLFWECELDASEQFPMGPPPVLVRSDQQNLFKRFDEIAMQFTDSHHPAPAHAVWTRALASYTHASLTKSTDKLIAIAGIASELSPKISDGYIAGLWKEHMATELLWYVDIDTMGIRQKQYHAPSFSWASVDGAVVPGEWQQNDILIEVQEACASPETSNPFGSVESGFVRIRGAVKQALLSPSPYRTAEKKVPRQARSRLPNQGRRWQIGTCYSQSMMGLQRWALALVEVFAPSTTEPKWTTICREVFEDTPPTPEMVEMVFMMWGADVYLDEDLFPDYDANQGFGEPRPVYCVVVAGQSTSRTAVRGLILEETAEGKGEYRRIGVFMTAHGDSMNVLGVPHRSETRVPCKEFDPDTHEHTIVIV